MHRAAVLIGVSTTGGLRKLQAVESGIAQMQAWAAGQGIEGDRLVVLTDQNAKVRAHQIVDAINALVQQRNLDQLIVYFSGHGIYNRGDVWLLSEAPGLAYEAVNVEGSIQAARTCGISHVVIISDACRVAADGIQALEVKGIEIFPNDPVDGMERPVDAYFACARGMPSLEVRNVVEAALNFSGVYTEVLSECLVGKHPDTLDLTEENGVAIACVPTYKLADKLEAEVPVRLKAKLGRIPPVNQTPVARITSRAAWISRLSPFEAAPGYKQNSVDVLGGATGGQWNAVAASRKLLDAILSGDTDALDNGLLGGDTGEDAGGSLLLSVAADLSQAPRPVPEHIRCGIRLRGERVHAVYGRNGRYAIADAGRRLVDVQTGDTPVTVLVEIDDGGSVLVPVIPGYLAELHFRDGELAHLAYEPLPVQAPGSPEDLRRAAERALLGSIGAAAGMGVLDIGDMLSFRLLAPFYLGWRTGPTLALYTAYACHDQGLRRHVRLIQHELERGTGYTFFDLALLSGRGELARAQGLGKVLSPVPMLSRGWSLLKVFGADLPPVLDELQACLRPSLWTLFNSAGTEHLVRAIDDERIFR